MALFLAAMLSCQPGCAATEADDDGGIAQVFKQFCLAPLDRTAIEQRAATMGLVETKRTEVGGTDMTFWRASNGADGILYSFDEALYPPTDVQIVGCTLTVPGANVNPIVRTLAKPALLGPPNDNAAPSLFARSAGWFFAQHGAANWVSVIPPFDSEAPAVILTVAQHRRTPRSGPTRPHMARTGKTGR